MLSLDAARVQLDAFGAHCGANPNPRIKALNRRLYQRACDASRHIVTMSRWAAGEDALGNTARRRAEAAFSLDNYRRVVAAVLGVT